MNRSWPRLLLLILLGAAFGEGSPAVTPSPNTPIEHFVVLMQQNRSFDHYFGAYPGADGHARDTCVPYEPGSQGGSCVAPYSIGSGSSADLRHSEGAFWAAYNGGQMDGFVQVQERENLVGALTMGYYDGEDLPYYWNLADEFVLFDRFFSSSHGGSVTNAMFWITGQAGPDSSRVPAQGYGDMPTIFDQLQEQGITWKFYVQNLDDTLNYRNHGEDGRLRPQVQWVPLLGFDRFIDEPAYAGRIVDMDEYFEDVRDGTLPAVSYIVGLGATEHPPSHPLSGQRFVRRVLQALIRSDHWQRSAFLLTYDGWGGWYDHVPPPQVDEHGYGFRVPALLVSPFARRGHVDSTQLDYTSVLRFIADNYDLEPLSPRAASANSFASALDFSQPPRQPSFIPLERSETLVAPAPRRLVIYLCYGLALLLALTAIASPLLLPEGTSSKNVRSRR